MTIKMIASDIDGTLINNEHKVTDYTREIVQKVRQQGVEFVIATGRNYDSAVEVAAQLGIPNGEMGIVSLNGLRVENPLTGYSEHGRTMTFEECRKFEVIGRKYHMGVLYCLEDIIYYHMDDLSFQDYELGVDEDRMTFFNDRATTLKINGLDDIKHIFDEGQEILKMVYIQNGDYTELVKERVAAEFDEDFVLLVVGFGWAEIMHHDVNKGDALVKYAATRGIKPEEILSFGDSDNDLTLIERCGCGVAMANARENLKAIADDIADSNDDNGVANYIVKNILKEVA